MIKFSVQFKNDLRGIDEREELKNQLFLEIDFRECKKEEIKM